MKKRQPKAKMPEAFSRYLLEGVRRIRDQATQGSGPESESQPQGRKLADK